jgi:hypothetical protein
MINIVTACSVGLVRSVGLADVLKLHFEPVDVIPVGLHSNSKETLSMLGQWCNWFIVMQEEYKRLVPPGFEQKVLVCEVGPDTYGQYGCRSHHPELIDKVWRWTRQHDKQLGIREYFRHADGTKYYKP